MPSWMLRDQALAVSGLLVDKVGGPSVKPYQPAGVWADAPSAALVKDLEQRGLLDDTIVIWGGEFGRTPFLQGKIEDKKNWGRDHHPYAFTIWMAGGGIKPGVTHGESDEFGFNVAKDPVHVHDFQATILHLLGVDHERLTFKFQRRRFRLTDVHGKVVRQILA